MSRIQNTKVTAAKEIDEYECSGTGPRPPVPGKESRTTKMIETGCPGSSTVGAAAIAAQASSVLPHADDILTNCDRVRKWRDRLSNLLSDEEGTKLFQKFVEDEAGPHGNYTIHLEFYFACRGLKQQTDPTTLRQFIGAIYRKYLRNSGNEIPVPSELGHTVRKILKNEIEPDANIYNDVQRQVEEQITLTTFPKFFQSKFYFDYAEQVQRPAVPVNNNYGIGYAACNSGNSINQYGGEMESGRTTAANLVSPCDSLDASCLNLQESLMMNSVLPTLHEGTELTVHDVSTKSLGSKKPKLTKEALLATEMRRLEIRPAGAHGYNVKYSSSYNPVSRQESRQQSCGSASQTDSDTRSIVSSKDGQPYMHRKPTSSESMRKCFNNNMSNPNTIVEPYSHERLKASRPPNQEEFVLLLTKKLEALEREQETMERVENTLKEAQKADDQPLGPKSFASHANAGLPHQANHHAFTTAILRKFSSISGDNDQDILDQHVSRVFSPLVQSPGTASPHQAAAISRPPPPLPHRTIDPMTEFASQSMRHSKPIPEHASSGGSMARLSEKSGINIDSGISMDSVEDKSRPISSVSAALQKRLEDVVRSREDVGRSRSRHILPTAPMGYHTNSLARVPDHNDDSTTIVFQFRDEEVPYRTKLPSKTPTLKMFKDVLHRKGAFRYFFRVPCQEMGAVQEEFKNDDDVLPLFEGKVMCSLTPLQG